MKQIRWKPLLFCSMLLSHSHTASAQEGEVAPSAELTEEEIQALSGEVIEMRAKKRATPTEPAGAAEIAKEELREMPGARGDALNALRSLPGVATGSGFQGSGGDLVIRGAPAEDSIYLLDGLQVPVTMHFGNFQSVLPTDMMSAIDFMPGGFGVEYGGSTAGLVHIHSSDVLPGTTTGFVELSFVNAGLYLAGPLWKKQNLRFQIGARRSLIDAVLPMFVPDDIDLHFDTYPQYYDGQFKVDWRPSFRHRVFASAVGSGDYLQITTPEEDPFEPMANGTLQLESSFWRSYGVWDYQGDDLQSRLLISVGSDTLAQRQLDGPAYEVKPLHLELREDFQLEISDRIALRMGAHLRRSTGHVFASYPRPGHEGLPEGTNLSADPVLDVDQAIDDFVTGEYMAMDLRLPAELRVSVGARMDTYSHIDRSVLSPRINATYPLTRSLDLNASAGRYSRPLHLAEAVATSLRPELSTQEQVGLRYQIIQGLSATLTGYHTDYQDLVVQRMDYAGGDIENAYENAGTGRSYGAETMLRLQSEALRGWLAYSFARSYRRDRAGDAERLFDFDQPHRLTAVASWQRGPWTLGGKFQWASGAPYTPVRDAIYLADPNVYRPIFGTTNSARFSASHQLDVRLARRFRFESWRMSAYLDVTNAYNQSQTAGYEYSFDYKEKQASTNEGILPAIGIKGEF